MVYKLLIQKVEDRNNEVLYENEPQTKLPAYGLYYYYYSTRSKGTGRGVNVDLSLEKQERPMIIQMLGL